VAPLLVFLLVIAAVVMFAVAFVSAWIAVRFGGWRATLSGHEGWLRAPPGVDPAFWQHRRRLYMCFYGYVACGIVMQIFMLVRRSM
jgi:hypothetical protein